MLISIVILVVLAIPAVVVVMVLRDLGDSALDSAAARVRNNAEIAKRAPFFQPLWRFGGALQVFALIPIAVCVKGATADQWRTMALVSAGLLAVGSLLLGLWWVLASRKV